MVTNTQQRHLPQLAVGHARDELNLSVADVVTYCRQQEVIAGTNASRSSNSNAAALRLQERDCPGRDIVAGIQVAYRQVYE